jgi:hypothetical protein
MPSLNDYLNISNQAYNPFSAITIDGYTPVDPDQETNGFGAITYISGSTIIIAFAGTGSWDTLKADIPLANGQTPPAFLTAIDYVNREILACCSAGSISPISTSR